MLAAVSNSRLAAGYDWNLGLLQLKPVREAKFSIYLNY